MNTAVFDLETNGMTGSSVLSASSIVFDDSGTIVDIFNRFYMPHESVNYYAVNVHGLTPRRILALRETIAAPYYFLDDCVSLVDFWESHNVEGVVVHNLSFDTSFLPELLQGACKWWCSMKGLTEICAIPKTRLNIKKGAQLYKWPKLGEAADVICNSPLALEPSDVTLRLEEFMAEGHSHVSLYDCFELYRILSRIIRHRPELLLFAHHLTKFHFPPKIITHTYAPLHDFFTIDILAYEKKLRSAI